MLLHRRARNRWAAGDCRQDICKIVIDSYLCNSENENGISPFNWHRVWRSIATSFANSRIFLHNKYVACLQLPPIWQRVIETAGRRTQSAVAVDRSGGGGETTNGSEQTNKKTVVYRVLQINSVYLSFFFRRNLRSAATAATAATSATQIGALSVYKYQKCGGKRTKRLYQIQNGIITTGRRFAVLSLSVCRSVYLFVIVVVVDFGGDDDLIVPVFAVIYVPLCVFSRVSVLSRVAFK